MAAASGDKTVLASPLFDMAQTVQVNGRGANPATIQNVAESNRIDSLGSEVFSVGAEIEKFADMEKLQVDSKNSTEMPQSLLSSQPCIVRDDFNRADSTNMGTNWTEQSGDFSISGNRAVGINDSEMVYNGNTTGDLACVDVYSGGNAQKVARVLLKYTSSSDNLRVLLQDSQGDGLYDRIYFDRDGGFVFNAVCATSLLTTPISSGRLTAYLDGTTLKGDIDNDFDGTIDQSYQCTNAPQKSGTKIVLSNFNSAQFDNFGTPPNTLTVTKTADTNDGVCNADCSLREAIAAAASGDTIQFASPLFDTAQTVQVNGQLTINKNLTINGRGANLTTVQNIAAASATSRVFLILSGTVNLSGLTITGGNLTAGGSIPGCFTSDVCGGGIFSGGNLTLTNCVVSNNTANGSELVFGAGLFINSSLTLINSTVSGNTATTTGIFVTGGGIYINDTATIINSTISGNSVVGNSLSQGGGINVNFGSLNIYNSTVTNNSVPNGNVGGGGGISKSGTVNAVNTIISGNTANTNPDLDGSLSASSTNNLVGGNAGLLPLGNYGGATPTHALLPTSAAVNSGSNCVVTQTCTVGNQTVAITTDQRGRGRDSRVDIGAYEMVGLTVTKTADTSDGVCDADCSLREAVAAAASGDTIVFASTLFDTPQTIQTNGQLTINKTLIINGRGSNLTTVQNIAPQGATSRAFFVDLTGNLTLSNLTVTGGNLSSGNFGGGIFNRNLLTVIGCQISGNNTATSGGGIRAGLGGGTDSPTTLIINSTISGNAAQSFGGGLNLSSGNATVINSTISGNQASTAGGISNSAGTTNIVNSTITANTATSGGGGGMRVEASTIILRNSIVAQNTAALGRPDISLVSTGTFTSNGNNLIGNSTDTANAITWQASDLLNQNALLAPLGFYGGATQTHALLSGSPALNTGNNCVTNRTCTANNSPVFLTADQRGASRVGNVDIGSFEANNAANGSFRANLPFARVGSNYNFVISPNNGAATYQLTGGNLPSGVNLSTNFAPIAVDQSKDLAPNAVVSLDGLPTQSGIFDFSITTTSGGNSVVTDYRLNVIPTTSANASVSGKVFTNDGNALRNAAVLLTDANGNTRKVQTGSFGVYNFDDLAVGQTYIIQVVSKKFTFAPQTIYLTDNVSEMDFTAQ